MHQGLVPLPHSLAVLLEQFGTGLGGLFANPLVPIGKYWVAVATAYGLFQHMLHNDGLIEPASAVNGLPAGQQTQMFMLN